MERYEEEHYSVPEADPVSIVRFLIEQQHQGQRDLIPPIWTRESAVSMFMTGQRNLTLEQVRKLSTGFKLSTDISSQGIQPTRPQSNSRKGAHVLDNRLSGLATEIKWKWVTYPRRLDGQLGKPE